MMCKKVLDRAHSARCDHRNQAMMLCVFPHPLNTLCCREPLITTALGHYYLLTRELCLKDARQGGASKNIFLFLFLYVNMNLVFSFPRIALKSLIFSGFSEILQALGGLNFRWNPLVSKSLVCHLVIDTKHYRAIPSGCF